MIFKFVSTYDLDACKTLGAAVDASIFSVGLVFLLSGLVSSFFGSGVWVEVGVEAVDEVGLVAGGASLLFFAGSTVVVGASVALVSFLSVLLLFASLLSFFGLAGVTVVVGLEASFSCAGAIVVCSFGLESASFLGSGGEASTAGVVGVDLAVCPAEMQTFYFIWNKTTSILFC